MSKNKRIAISVDWDYFFPDLNPYDFGHKESDLFIRDLWYLRGHDRGDAVKGDPTVTLQPSGHKTFWKTLRKMGLKPMNLVVSESHAYGYSIATAANIDLLIVFDQHIDVFSGMKDAIDCENWLRHVIEQKGRGFNVMMITPRPPTEEERVNAPNNMIFLSLENLGHYLKATEFTTLMSFVCRSGAWTPPWADEAFFEFLNGSGIPWMEHWDRGLTDRTWDIEALRRGNDERAKAFQQLEELMEAKIHPKYPDN